MSRAQKRLDRLFHFAEDNGAEITWDDLVAVMAHLGFEASCSGGSHHSFYHRENDDLISSIVKPHPGNKVKRIYCKTICAFLREKGYVKDDD